MSSRDSFRPLPRNLLFGALLTIAILFNGGSSLSGASAASRAVYTALPLLQEVMPEADSFSEKAGEPPVISAFKEDSVTGEKTLMGYIYLTSDVPPEANGYSAPINVLIGLGLDGNITGLKVVYYRESLRNNWGDFLALPGFQEQFVGKHATEDFRVNYDVDGISRATITVRAMAKGIRHSIRKVAQAYLR